MNNLGIIYNKSIKINHYYEWGDTIFHRCSYTVFRKSAERNEVDRMEKAKKLSFTAVLLLIGFVPLIVSSIIISLITSGRVTSQLTREVYDKLYVTTESLWIMSEKT